MVRHALVAALVLTMPLAALGAEAEGMDAWVQAIERPAVIEAGPPEAPAAESQDASGWVSTEDLLGLTLPMAYYRDPAGALKVDPLYLDLVDAAEFDIPVVVNDEVAKWVRYFTGAGRKYYARWLARSTSVRPMMYRELEARGLPSDLVYLSMIESGYSAKALSHAGAGGMWQFMPATGRMYDLRVDGSIDDRRDPELATIAAAEHLKDLHEMFGHWYLAFAAYNAGPGRVNRAIKGSGSRDFWVHARGSYLHSETDNYVPKILAAAIIGKHPERYGFTEINYEPPMAYDSAFVDTATDLAVIAECAGVSVGELQELNPALRGSAVPREGHVVRLPVGRAAAFSTALAAIPASERIRTVEHVVQKGETLSVIASRYGVSTSSLVDANRLRNANRITIGMRLVVPTSGASSVAAVASSSAAASPAKPAPAPKATSYTVARGDTLSGIASRFSVSVDDLRSWNSVRGDVIVPGQRLTLKGGTPPASAVATERVTVRAGDTLSGIASRYGVSTADLASWNNIRDASTIRVGQVLQVRGAAPPAWDTHTVARGDTLSGIASRYGCSTRDLCSWNGLGTSSVIQPGQRLKVKRS